MIRCLFAVTWLAVLAGVSGSVGAAESTLLSKATPEQQALFAKIKTEILREAAVQPRPLADAQEDYFYVYDAEMRPLLRAYSYSHDPVFLETFVPMMERVLSQRYLDPIKPEWNGWYAYKGFGHTALVDHDAIMYFTPVLLFVKEVRADPKLQAKYGAKAEAWLKDVEVSIRNWDKRGCWHDLGHKGGWYTTVPGYPDPKTGEIVPLGEETVLFTSGTVPYNKVHALFQSLALAWQVTGDPWYKTRMEKCVKFFRDHWRVDDKHAEWNYRDLEFPSDFEGGKVGAGKAKTGVFVHPHQGYYGVDVAAVVCSFDAGVPWAKADLEKLVQTNTEFMFLGDAKDPKFKMINGWYKAEGKYEKGTLWTDLAHFSPKIRELWKVELDRDCAANKWMCWASSLDYLIETSYPVSWEPRHARPDGAPARAAPAKNSPEGERESGKT